MKKRMLALLLAAVLCFGLLPVTAAADGDNTSYVASIGEEKYTTFEAALAAANEANKSTGATITLLKDNIDIKGDITGNVTIKPKSHAIAYKDARTDELTVKSGGTLTFDGHDSMTVFNVPIKIENGATVELILLKTAAPVTFTDTGEGTTLTIDGSNFNCSDTFVVPEKATVHIKAEAGSAVTFNSIQIQGGRTLQDVIDSGYGAQGGENGTTWIDMNVAEYNSTVQIVSAPLSDLTVEVQKGSGNPRDLTYTPLKLGTDGTYSTTASAGEALRFTATANTTESDTAETASYSWKVDGNGHESGSTYTWNLGENDIRTEPHTIVCTATADGFSLTKTLTVTINQKPVKVEAYSPSADKTDTTWYDNISTALSGIMTAYSRATVSITENQTLPSTLPSADLTFELNQKTLTGNINTKKKVTLKGGTVDGTLSCADLTLDNVTLSQKLTVDEEKTLTIQNAPITLSGGISYSGLKSYLETNNLILKQGTSYISYANTGSDYSDSVTIGSHTLSTTGACVCGAQEPVEYLNCDTNGTSWSKSQCWSYTLVTGSDTNWSSGWHVVKGNVTISDKLSISNTGDEAVNLILCDGATLNVGGIDGARGASLIVYAQSSDTLVGFQPSEDTSVGKLEVGSYVDVPHSKINASISVTTLTVYGGTISANATGGSKNYAISATEGTMKVYDGSITATAGDADGVSTACDVRTLTMSGGTLTAMSGTVVKGSGVLIEAGISAGVSVDTVTVSGGTIIATAGEATNSYDIACLAFALSGTGTVQSSRDNGNDNKKDTAVRLYVRTIENESTSCSCTISGGTIRLAESSFEGTFTLGTGVNAADVLADGYCFAKVENGTDIPLKRSEASTAKKVVLHKLVLDASKEEPTYGTDDYYKYNHQPSECTDTKCDYCSFQCGTENNPHQYNASAENPTGLCIRCGYACPHTNANFANSGRCRNCGMGCPHASVDETTGTCTDCNSTEIVAVAKVEYGISTTYYANFDAAVTAANAVNGEATLTLLQDCTSAGVMVSSQIKLVLNDKTLTLDEGAALTVAGSSGNAATLNVVNAANDEDLRPNTPGAGKLDGTVELTTEKSFLRVYSGEITKLEIKTANASSGVQLYGGKYGTITIGNECTLTLADLLASGYAYRTTDSWVTSSTEKTLTNVSVQAPPISNLTVTPTSASVVVGYETNSAPTLSVTPTTTGDNNLASVTYQWYKVDGTTETEIENATSQEYTIETSLDKGTYKYVCKATLDGYTRTSAEITVTVTNPSISASDITAPTAKISLTYNNTTNQQLINEGTTPSGTTMKYRLGETGEWTDDVSTITGKDAGQYTVYWMIEGGENYEDVPESDDRKLTVNIGKADLNLKNGSGITYEGMSEGEYAAPLADSSRQYTSQAQSITNGSALKATGAKFVFKIGNGQWTEATGDNANTTNGINPEATDAGTYTVSWYIDGGTNYNDVGSEEQPNSVECTINKMRLYDNGTSVDGKTYDGTTTATAEVKLKDAREIAVSLTAATDYTVSAAFADANVGNNKSVAVTITLTEAASKNYCFVKDNQSSSTLTLTCTASITKATAPTASAGSLTVYNGLAHEYTFNFASLRPDLGTGKTYGTTTYEIKTNDLNKTYFPDGNVSLDSTTGSATLNAANVNSTETNSLGSLVVTVTPTNYEVFDLTLNVSAANQLTPTGSPTLSKNTLTLGEKLSTITLSGSMTGPSNETVEGKFAWDAPNSTPEVGPQTPSWTFTPNDNVTYKTVTGTASITVKGNATATSEGSLTVYTKLAHTYTFDFKTLLPELTYGTTTYKIEANKQDEHYKLDTVYFPSGNVSLNADTGVVTLKAEKIDSTVEDSLGKLIVTVSSTNYYDFYLTLNVASANQTALTGAPTYTPIRTSGKTLADAALTPNATWPEGELAWVDAAGNVLADTTRVDANKAYTWRFTPTDLQYATLTGSITLYSSSPYIPSIKPTTPEITFTDVPQEAYYADAVRWAVENDVTTGVGGGKFDPNASCTRAQIVTFLWRAAGQPQPKTAKNPFTDVAEQDYFYTAVLWAVENGITTGTTATTFSPGAACTRAQAVSFLYRLEQARGGGFTGAWMFRLPFADVPEWCYEAVAWCYMQKITGGTTALTFSPDDACTRAQIVTFLHRSFG